MKAKEFEETCLYRMRQEEELGRAMMVRYGVQGSFRKGEPIDYRPFIDSLLEMNDRRGIETIVRAVAWKAQNSAEGWQPHRSLPDFTGVLPRGYAFDFDCKLCGDASLSLHDEKFKKRQLAYLLKRSKFGAITFVLIHFSERKLKRGAEPAQTWAFPVVAAHPFWEAIERGEKKSIGRADCAEYAVPVAWDCLPRSHTPRPNIVAALYELAALSKAFQEA